MARSALGKLAEADELDKRASGLSKKDPASSTELKELARNKRKSAIRQLKRKPGKKRRSRTVL